MLKNNFTLMIHKNNYFCSSHSFPWLKKMHGPQIRSTISIFYSIYAFYYPCNSTLGPSTSYYPFFFSLPSFFFRYTYIPMQYPDIRLSPRVNRSGQHLDSPSSPFLHLFVRRLCSPSSMTFLSQSDALVLTKDSSTQYALVQGRRHSRHDR